MVGRVGLPAEPIAPRLAVCPLLPTGGPQQLTLRIVELGAPSRVGPYPFGHARQRRPYRPGERHALVDRLQELDLGAVEVSDDGTLGPATPHRVVLGRQVMKMKDIGAVRPSGTKRCLPDRRQMLDEVGGHRRQHHVRGALAVLERRMHRHRQHRSRYRPPRTPAPPRSSRGTARQRQRRTSAHASRPPTLPAIRSPAPPTSQQRPTPSTGSAPPVPTHHAERTATP